MSRHEDARTGRGAEAGSAPPSDALDSVAPDNPGGATAVNEPLPAWFLGPKAENADVLERAVVAVLRDYSHWRKNYFPSDRALLTRSIQRRLDDEYDRLEAKVADMLAELRRNFPFYSPRYIGHQLSDTTLASIVGHIAGLLFNPNNVTPEAAPVTVDMEIDSCTRLLEMLGYAPPPEPVKMEAERDRYDSRLKAGFGWAHICSGGTVANIEALWVARAVTYFPLAARDVARELRVSVPVKLPSYKESVTVGDANAAAEIDIASDDIDEYCLLLLKPNEKIYLLARLVQAVAQRENLSPEHASARTAELLRLSRRGPTSGFHRQASEFEPRLFAPVTAHYSVTKAADLLGIGRSNIAWVQVDANFRLDVADLRKKLRACLNERAVPLAVIGIVGTTEEGAIDPIHDILDLREEFENRDVSFWLHVDAAWGGYFRSLLNLSAPDRLDVLAHKLGLSHEACPPPDGDIDAWIANVFVPFVEARVSDTDNPKVDRTRIRRLLHACGAAVDDDARLTAVRGVVGYALRTGLLVSDRRSADAGEADAEWERPGPLDIGLQDYVDLLGRRTSDRLTLRYGKYRRDITLVFDSRETCSALLGMSRAESITIDPHKMGYVGYPCGVIAFRNDRVRHFLTQRAPYITAAEHSALVHHPPRHSEELASASGAQRVSTDAFAPFTLEGSRPGASAAALWLSSELIPPDLSNHGRLIRASALAALELYQWLTHWDDIATQNDLDLDYQLLSYTPGPPDTNIVIFAVKKARSRSLEELNEVTRSVYDRFSIKPELGDREYSYSQPFFLSHTTFDPDVYPYASVQPFLTRAGIRQPRVEYGRRGLEVLRATAMNPYVAEMRRLDAQHVYREFMTPLHDAASAACRAL